MTFPEAPFGDIGEFARAYADKVSCALGSLDAQKMSAAADILQSAYQNKSTTVFTCGNGGSAAISNHFHCDHLKSIQTDTVLRPNVVSLVSVIETITAIANDLSYDDVFLYQLRTQASEGDVLVTVSSSGDSENVVRALEWARENGIQSIAMTGFSGGRTAALADVNLHVAGDNYGVIEDAHQSVMHVLAQFVRQRMMTDVDIKNRKF